MIISNEYFRLVVVTPQIFWSRRAFPAISIPKWRPATQEQQPKQKINCTNEIIGVESPIMASPRSFKYISRAPSSLEIFGTAPACKIPTTTSKRRCGIIKRELVVAVFVKTGRYRRRMHDRTKMKRFHFHAESLWISHSSVLQPMPTGARRACGCIHWHSESSSIYRLLRTRIRP